MFANSALGFPVAFNIYWSDGTKWNLANTYTGFPTPYRNDWIVLPLGATVNANGILIVATTLGQDNDGNYVFQLGEVGGGYSTFFDHLVYLGNNGSANQVEIQNLGSRTFDANKLAVWNYDQNNPIISGAPGASTLKNIYAPNIVYQGGTFWNIYFGGEDGTPAANGYLDSISFLTTNNNFNSGSFSNHVPEINYGGFIDVNNESVVKVSATDWRMVYTTLSSDGLNKPGYAVSTDGAHWTPNAGTSADLLNMSGYPGWANANINGVNVLFYAEHIWYLYLKGNDPVVNYAQSSDGVNFTYGGVFTSGTSAVFAGGCAGMNDMKQFGSTYIWMYHCNTNKIWFSLGQSPTAPSSTNILFQSTADIPTEDSSGSIWTNPEAGVNTGVSPAPDPFMVSVGMVSDGTRLYGVLYGASNTPELDSNAVFARWLQHKVVFQNAETTLSWMNSNGPDNVVLRMVPDQSVETGTVTIYDTDGTTLVGISPSVTIRQGDQWAFQ